MMDFPAVCDGIKCIIPPMTAMLAALLLTVAYDLGRVSVSVGQQNRVYHLDHNKPRNPEKKNWTRDLQQINHEIRGIHQPLMQK